MFGRSVAKIISAGALLLSAPSAFAQDAVWEHQQRVQAQQDEERRMNGIVSEMNQGVAGTRADGSAGYAPNTFVSFPPEAWDDWVKHGQEQQRQAIEDRFRANPAYEELLRGVWTYRDSGRSQSPRVCAATFWTRNGGVSFIHLGGKDDFTFLGFFGASIPRVDKPRTMSMELIQSGESQRVRVLNIRFGSVKSMGMLLFNVRTPAILLGAIEDRQDFELRSNGETLARGAWHSGLAARDKMASCLASQGYLPRK